MALSIYNGRLMNKCDKLVENGMIIRYVATICFFGVLSVIVYKSKFVDKHILVLLPIALTLLDMVDNIFKYNSANIHLKCTHTFFYQMRDKICDVISYMLTYCFLYMHCFQVDNILGFLILYRFIGVVLFSVTENRFWLVLFFDFVKEYLIYLYIFKKDVKYLPFLMFCKSCFELFWHRNN